MLQNKAVSLMLKQPLDVVAGQNPSQTHTLDGAVYFCVPVRVISEGAENNQRGRPRRDKNRT